MKAALAPHWAGPEFGSKSDLARLVEAIRTLKPRGKVS